MSSFFMDASVVLGVVSIGLTAALLTIYRKVYLQARTSFGLALVVFASAFLLQSGLLVYSYLATMPLIPNSLTPWLFAIGLCEATGLTAMTWTASR